MSKNNVIEFEDIKLLKEAGDAIDGMEKILNEAMQHADNPDVQKFLQQMTDKMEELAKEMQGLDEDIQKFEESQDESEEGT